MKPGPLLHRTALRRFYPALCLPLLLLSGCKIERTPNAYIDRLDTPEEEVQAATEELVDRLLSTAPALQRGNLNDVTTALSPHTELSGVGPAGEVIAGNAEFVRTLQELTAGNRVAMNDLRVEVDPGNDVAWFRSVMILTDPDDIERRMPFTGVFVQHEGEWWLRQGNLTAPVSLPSDSLPPADSAAAGG